MNNWTGLRHVLVKARVAQAKEERSFTRTEIQICKDNSTFASYCIKYFPEALSEIERLRDEQT